MRGLCKLRTFERNQTDKTAVSQPERFNWTDPVFVWVDKSVCSNKCRSVYLSISRSVDAIGPGHICLRRPIENSKRPWGVCGLDDS